MRERKDESLRIRLTTEDKESWERAAAAEGLGLSAWMRKHLNAAAARKSKPKQPQKAVGKKTRG